MRIRPLSFVAVAVLASSSALVGLAAPDAGAASTRSPTYYVSLGDSYSVGFQPGAGSTPGYTVYVARKTHLKLVNFGCGGATTTSILDTVGCPDALPHTVGGVTYPTTTQAAAAESFISQHRGHIGLITVSIGGNDITRCAGQSNAAACIVAVANSIKTNVAQLAGALRAAAGPKVPIIGSTYPDVVLGAYVYPTNPAAASTINLAKLSVVAFKSIINPALTQAYASAKGRLVDVTAATGGYIPLTRTVDSKTYGTIPVAVASVCAYTWFCLQGNIHATTPGYTVIGKLIVTRYHLMKLRSA
jgi:lysophospholipase L1-like esterase